MGFQFHSWAYTVKYFAHFQRRFLNFAYRSIYLTSTHSDITIAFLPKEVIIFLVPTSQLTCIFSYIYKAFLI